MDGGLTPPVSPRRPCCVQPDSRSPGWPTNCRSSTKWTRRITWKGFGARACKIVSATSRGAISQASLDGNQSRLEVFAGRDGHVDAALASARKRQGEIYAVDKVHVIETCSTPTEAPDDQQAHDAMVSIEGENMRGVTWFKISEVASGDWASRAVVDHRSRQGSRGRPQVADELRLASPAGWPCRRCCAVASSF